jgi:DNA-binding transcriptional regulator YiaG
MPQLAKLLEFGITATAIEEWEKNQNRPTEPHRTRIVEFLGFDPDSKKSTGGSPAEHLT